MSHWQSDEWEAADASDEEGEEELDGEWELDPNDPSHPDYDLSESAGYANWEPPPKPVLLRRGTVLLLTVLAIIGLLIPLLVRLTY
jgi:hypothetical protein